MNELVPLSTYSTDELMQMIGQGVVSRPSVARLSINRQADDADGNTLPVGTYSVYHGETGGNVYGKPAYFQPLASRYQYRLYDETTEKFLNRSILFRNWNEDILDELGGMRCGKISQKDLDKISPERRELNKKIKCIRNLYGLLTMDGVTITGDKVSIHNLPCTWRLTGNNLRVMGDVLDGITKQRKVMFNFRFKLTTKREQTGSNVYYTTVCEVEDKFYDLPQESFEVLKKFNEQIDMENSEIMTKCRQAQARKANEKDKAVLEAAIKPLDADFVEADLNDEIPNLTAISAG